MLDTNSTEKKYIYYLSDKCLKPQILKTYSVKQTPFVSNKISTICLGEHNLYLNDKPSIDPVPLLIVYNHYDTKIISDHIYKELRWSCEKRLIHNIVGQILCYKYLKNNIVELYFKTREYIDEDNESYLIYNDYE